MKSLLRKQNYVVSAFLTILVFFCTFLIGFGEAEARTVKLFYFLPNDRTYNQTVVDNMKAGILRVQSFYADQMEAHGHGRMTFSIEKDGNGDPIVHHVNGAHSDSHYKSTGTPGNEIHGAFDIFNTSSSVQLVVLDISRSSGGRGVGTKQRGTAIVDGGWRDSTAAHELGHAFGLQHDFRDDSYVMSYGEGLGSLSEGAAHFLSVNPYFNSSVPLQAGAAPSVELLSSTDYTYDSAIQHVPVTVRVRDPDGVQQVTLFVKTPEGINLPGGFLEVIEYRNLSGETDVTVTFKYEGNPTYDMDLLNTLKHTIYVSAVDTQGNRIDHQPSWTLQATDIPKLDVPLSERSPRVAESIYGVVSRFIDRNVSSYDDIVEPHLRQIADLFINHIRASDSPLQSNDFDGLTGVTRIILRFESGYSDSTPLPAGIFEGLTSLRSVQMNYYTDTYGDDPTLFPILPFPVGLQKVGDGRFKAVVHTGAPSDMELPLIVVNGSITGGTTSVTIPAGHVESDVLTVTRTPGTTAAVVVDLERVVASPEDAGYVFYKSSYPLELFSPLAGAPAPVAERTPKVLGAIIGAVPGMNLIHHNVDLRYMINGKFVDKKYNMGHYVSEAQLAAITSLNVSTDNPFGNLITGNWFNLAPEITALKSGDFDGMPNLESLLLSGTELSSLSGNTFDKLTNLTSLDLSGNKLRSLPVGVFDKLTHLESLDLSGNELHSLPVGLFDKLTNLERLYLSSNQFSSLPAGLFDKLTNLTYLNLLDNPLRSLPTNYFSKLTNLETLFLPPAITPPSLPGGNTVTPVAGRTPMVRDAIVAAVPGVNSASAVTAAHLAAITELEVGEGSPNDDGSITLDGAGLTGLKSGDFDNLVNLKGLGIGGTFSALPADIFDPLVNLEGLGILSTQLRSLPDGLFNNLFKLKSIGIFCTQLRSLPTGIFDSCTNLNWLYIAGTQLSSLPDGIFDNFTNVPFVILNNNQFSSLPAGIFDKASMSLLLNNNKLSSLPDGIFTGIFDTAPDLTGISILGIPLGEVPADRLDELGEYTTLNLTGNAVDPLPLTISLKKVGNGQFKAVAPTGAPFKLVLPITVTNGAITGGATRVTIPVGSVESETFSVTRTAGTTLSVSVDIGTLPSLWRNHSGYTLVKSPDLPLVFTEFGGLLSVSARTPEVRDAIVRAVPGVNSAANVTATHLAAITRLGVRMRDSVSVKADDFDGLTRLTGFTFHTGHLTLIPDGLFDDLSNLTSLSFISRVLTLPHDIFDPLTNLTELELGTPYLTSLPAGIFDQLVNLTTLIVSVEVSEQLTSLPAGIFNQLTNLTTLAVYIGKLTSLPDGLLAGLSSLTTAELGSDANENGVPFPLTVSLEKVGTDQFKAVAPIGAPFNMVLPISVTNGSITGGATSITIPAGNVESRPLTVTRTAGRTGAVTVNIGTLPSLPSNHDGYVLVKSTGLPLAINPNNAPVFRDGTSTTRSVAENTAANTNIGTAISATDADNDTLTYMLGGTDVASFSIVSTSGQLRTKAALDFENKTSYSLTITVSDGKGGRDTVAVTINVTDVNEQPTSTKTYSVGDDITTLPSGFWVPDKTANGASFQYSNGQVTITFNDEGYIEEDGTTYTCDAATGCKIVGGQVTQGKIQATTGQSQVPPPVTNTAPVFTDGTSTTRAIAENSAANTNIGTPISATDADNDTLTYSLGSLGGPIGASGSDAAAFRIVSTTGQLQTRAALDYETKASYTFIVSVSDSRGGTDSISVTINITDVDETIIGTRFVPLADRTSEVRDAIVNAVPNVSNAADVTKAHVAAITNLNLRNAGITALTDGDFSGMTSLTSLNLHGNHLSSLPPRIFEGLTSLRTVRLGGNAVNPLPFIVTLESVGLGQFRAVAPAGALFNIVVPVSVTNGSVTGGATTVTIPHGSLVSETLTVTRTAGTTAHVTVDIGALPRPPRTHYGYMLAKSGNLPLVVIRGTNTAPVFSDGTSTTRSVAENTPSNTNIGSPISATDVDNDTLTYTLGGTDATSFSLDSSTGQLRTRAALDYERKTSYSVTVTVSDSHGGSDSITVRINVTDVRENRAPVFTEGSTATRSVEENTGVNVNIGTAVAATDADGNTLTYTLGGTDAASFSIVSTSGQLRTKAALDYETKTVYTVILTVSDGTLTDTITVTINVTDVDERQQQQIIAVCQVGDILGPGESCTYPDTDAVFSVQNDGKSRWNIPNLPPFLQWINQVSIGGSLRVSTTINGVNYHIVAEQTGSSWEIKEIGDQGEEEPETPEPNPPTTTNPTLNVTTAIPLTEATLHGGIITLNLTDGTFESSSFRIRNAVSVSGITGVTVDPFGGERISDTQATIELEYDGNLTATETLTVSVGAGAIQGYDGAALTSHVSVTAVTESITVSPTSLTASTLDEAEITITLSGRKFESSVFDIRDGVSVSGITGVTYPWYYPDRESDTEISLELEFDGDITRDSTLTFTVGADAIAGYNGPDLTAQVSVSASTSTPTTPSGNLKITATTTSPLTEATLDDSVVTLTLTGGRFVDSDTYIGAAVSLSGIAGVTINDIDRESATELEVELAFNGNLNADGTLTFRVGAGAIVGYNGSALTVQVSVSASTDTPVDTGDQTPETPETPETPQQPNPGGTPTLTVTAATQLTEATLHGGVVSLNLSGGTFEDAFWDLDDEISVSGITGVSYDDFFDVDRISGTEVQIVLSFDGNMTQAGTLTFTVNSGAIVGYEGADLTATISVSAVSESVTASTTAPLTEATLDGSVVTLTLSGRTFVDWIPSDGITVSGIAGVTFSSFWDLDQVSDTKVTIELTFNGNMTTDGTLTFSVGADAIAGYAGSSLTAQVRVTASRLNALGANFPNPFNPETWIPYQLAKPSDVTLTIYNMRGVVVRELRLGHQAAGVYTSRSRAIYWDGRNAFGEKVASGVYFYMLKAGDFTATRKMLIRK